MKFSRITPSIIFVEDREEKKEMKKRSDLCFDKFVLIGNVWVWPYAN